MTDVARGESPVDFEQLFAKVPLLLHVLGPDHRSLVASDAYLAATMKTPETLYGLDVFEAFPEDPDDPETTAHADLRASLHRAESERKPDWMAVQHYPMELPDGRFEERYWSPVNAPIYDDDGELTYVVQIAQDVTDFVAQRQTQAVVSTAVESPAEPIEAEILQRSSELHELNRQLHAASDAKNVFLSRMSHELRTPLTAILGFGELLSLDEPDAERRSWIAAIRKAGNHLLEIVNEVLDISRIESGDLSLSLESASMEAVLGDALELMGPVAETHSVEIVASAQHRGLYVMADNQRLKQVLINLIANGVKYNHAGGRVEITFDHDEDRVRIHVADTGRGIDADGLRRLFVPFERLDAPTTGIEGTGLGLALSHNLVEAMGGTLTVQSTVGVGSTFTVDLARSIPVAVAAQLEEDESLLAPRTYSTDRRLLYIEDTVANARLIEQILRRRPSVNVLSAMLGRLGLELARDHLPDMILLDLHLPDVHGIEVLAELRADPRTRDIPVVVLSADATKRQVTEVMEGGAQDYLTKPIGISRLLETVDGLIDPDG